MRTFNERSGTSITTDAESLSVASDAQGVVSCQECGREPELWLELTCDDEPVVYCASSAIGTAASN